MFSACDPSHRLSFFVNSGLNHFGADENNSLIEFESNWFTGIHFFVAFKRPDGSINVLLNQNDDFSFNTATITGKVFSEPNGLPPFEPLLKVSNLYKDNLGRYHLNISGKKEELCYDGFSEVWIKTVVGKSHRKTLEAPLETPGLWKLFKQIAADSISFSMTYSPRCTVKTVFRFVTLTQFKMSFRT